MADLANQKVLRITDKKHMAHSPEFITEEVVEEKRLKLTYYRWISRLMCLLATISLSYGVCATLVILKLVPEILVDPQIFVEHMSDSDSLVKREYVNYHMESREKMMINFMKQYIELRNTYIKDEREMKNRWLWGGLVSYLSTYKVYKEFEKTYPQLQAEMQEKDASRSVEIISVEKTGGDKSNTWTFEFKTYDYTFKDNNNSRKKTVEPIIEERYWTANIRGYIDVNRRTAYRRLLNPLGFVVYGYYQSEIEL